jgi:hypothetical protein
MSRTRTAVRLALGSCLGALALAAPASAATLGVDHDGAASYLHYAAAAGEANHLHVTTAPDGRLAFTDPGAAITAHGPACAAVSSHEARCAAAAAPSIAVSLGDRDDELVLDANKPAVVGGDAGNDRLTGGPANDGLWGGAGNDVLDGRGGADFMAGQDGTDTVSYAGRTAPVTVDLIFGGLGTEGQAGERDTVASDVERAVGGAGADTLTGNDGPNTLDGGPGADTVVGGGGADDLKGGPGADTLRARDGVADKVDCGPDADRVDADAGDTVRSCEGAAPPVTPGGQPGTPAPGSGAGTLTIPFSFTFGSVKVPAKPVVLHHGRVTLTVSCPEGMPGGRCAGVITLERAPAARRAVASRRTKRRGLRLGSQDYAIRAGRTRRVSVRIAKFERRRLARRGSDRVDVYLRRSRTARKATKVGTLKVHASRRTKRRPSRAS